MHLFYLLFCLIVSSAKSQAETAASLGLQKQNQGNIPLNVAAYQHLPQEHSLAFSFAPALHNLDSANKFEIPQEDSYNAAYRLSSSQNYQTGYKIEPNETQVHKHVYIHVPPKDFEEEDAIQPRVRYQAGSKQRHYKLVFIKTPAAPNTLTPIVSAQPQNEENTLIYVLHKKPETQPDIIIPTPEPTKPSQPEVYFIKYKTKRDEAPVYGPPPVMSLVQTQQALARESKDFIAIKDDKYEMVTTTELSQNVKEEEEQQPQFINEESSTVHPELFNTSTVTNLISDDVQSTTSEPSSQYFPLDTTLAPIVVKRMEKAAYIPAASHAAPKRSNLFQKKRK